MVLRAKGAQIRTFLAVVALAVSGAAVVHAADSNPLPPGVVIIEAEAVIALARDHDDFVMIDSRTLADREMGYIEGSIALPDDRTSCETLANISKRLDQPLIFYCNGVKCVRSRNAVQRASACGYSRLYWFRGGYQEWRDKHFPVLRPMGMNIPPAMDFHA